MALPVLSTILTLSSPAGQQKLSDFQKFLNEVVCRLHTSCHPKLEQITRKVGYAGYSKGEGQTWSIYLENGLMLWEKPGYPLGAKDWYVRSGYWERLKNAGLDPCCLRQSLPPSEAFPFRTQPRKEPISVKLPDGRIVLADPDVFDPNSYQRELDSFTQSQTGTQPLTVAPTLAPASPLALPLLIGYFLTRST